MVFLFGIPTAATSATTRTTTKIIVPNCICASSLIDRIWVNREGIMPKRVPAMIPTKFTIPMTAAALRGGAN